MIKPIVPASWVLCAYNLLSFFYITKSFILLDKFKLLILEDWFSISRHPKELHGWPKLSDDYIKWLDSRAMGR